jgi:hypothetical protein
MDGGARIAEVSSTFKFTTSTRAVASETMPNPISLLCAPAVIKKFIRDAKSGDPRKISKMSMFQRLNLLNFEDRSDDIA